MIKKVYENWKLDVDEDAVLWLTLDQKGGQFNILNEEVIKEFKQIVSTISKKQEDFKGIVLKSGKATGFCLGADIKSFTQLKNQKKALKGILEVQEIFTEWEILTVPTVAMINGTCLGGGLELALACHYRIAASDNHSILGLPEVKLGIHPGFGGTVRLVHLIGVFRAMRLMLTGRSIKAKEAKKKGVIDLAVPERVLERAAKAYVLKKPYKQQPPLWLALLEAKVFRPWISRYFYSILSKKVKKTHYPAPYVILNRWSKDGALGANAMRNEAKSVTRLLFSQTSQNLVRLFFLQEKLKKLGKKSEQKISHVHVIGAGTMGTGIAIQCLSKGLSVSLQESNKKQMSQAIKRIAQYANHLYKDDPFAKRRLMDCFFSDSSGDQVKKADVVIEAIFEDLDAKQALFKAIEPKLKPEAILASNTSSLPLSSIASVLKDSNRLVGIHFFNPPNKMQLVEVVSDQNTSKTSVDDALAFVKQISRLPLPVKSSAGFLVNRLLMPYLLESMLMIEEGHSPRAIDQLAISFGMPMGPLALIDKIGLDICLDAAQILSNEFGGEIPDILQQKVKQEKLGCKTQKGFYTYSRKGKPIQSFQLRGDKLPQDTKDRLILPMLREAIDCLKEKVVTTADLVDVGIVFGTGFAPFRGGIIHYAVSNDIEKQIKMLGTLETRYGARFKVDEDWKKILQEGGAF